MLLSLPNLLTFKIYLTSISGNQQASCIETSGVCGGLTTNELSPAAVELETKVHKVFTITGKAPIMAYFLLEAATTLVGAFP